MGVIRASSTMKPTSSNRVHLYHVWSEKDLFLTECGKISTNLIASNPWGVRTGVLFSMSRFQKLGRKGTTSKKNWDDISQFQGGYSFLQVLKLKHTTGGPSLGASFLRPILGVTTFHIHTENRERETETAFVNESFCMNYMCVHTGTQGGQGHLQVNEWDVHTHEKYRHIRCKRVQVHFAGDVGDRCSLHHDKEKRVHREGQTL